MIWEVFLDGLGLVVIGPERRACSQFSVFDPEAA
jgi:hypothetical protein